MAPGFHQASSGFQLGIGLDVSVNLTLAGDTASLFPEGLARPTAFVLCLGLLRHAGCGSQGSRDPCATALGPGPVLGEPAELGAGLSWSSPSPPLLLYSLGKRL